MLLARDGDRGTGWWKRSDAAWQPACLLTPEPAWRLSPWHAASGRADTRTRRAGRPGRFVCLGICFFPLSWLCCRCHVLPPHLRRGTHGPPSLGFPSSRGLITSPVLYSVTMRLSPQQHVTFWGKRLASSCRAASGPQPWGSKAEKGESVYVHTQTHINRYFNIFLLVIMKVSTLVDFISL